MNHEYCPHCHGPLLPRAIAKAAGETFYTPATPCAKCGARRRYVSSGNCASCHAERKRKK